MERLKIISPANFFVWYDIGFTLGALHNYFGL